MMWTFLFAFWLVQTPAPPSNSVDRFAAATLEESKAILDADPGLASTELSQKIGAKGEVFLRTPDLPNAERLFRIASEVANRAGDRLEAAKENFQLGLVFSFRGEFALALQQYKS